VLRVLSSSCLPCLSVVSMVDILTHGLYTAQAFSGGIRSFFCLTLYRPFSSSFSFSSVILARVASARHWIRTLDINQRSPHSLLRAYMWGERDQWDFLRIWHLIYTAVSSYWGQWKGRKKKMGNGRIVHVANQAEKNAYAAMLLTDCLLVDFIYCSTLSKRSTDTA